MNHVEVSTVKPEEIAEIFIDLSNDDIRKMISQLSTEQLSAVISHLNEKNTQDWKEKTQAVIQGLSNQSQFEVAGRSLSVPQIINFLSSELANQENSFNKLQAILVGMSHETFEKLLSEISENELQILLQTSLSEPLQHQLTVFNHEMNNKYLLASEDLNKLMYEIEHLVMENVGRNDLIQIKNKINDMSLSFNQALEKMKNALKIAWNTHRLDLVESLNAIKDKYFHTLNNFIGHSETDKGATGLYELLNQRIYSVFGNPYDLNDPESLSNGEPAIEALVKFSIWYLKDYWEVGLLPHLKSLDELELNSQAYDEKERAEYRDKLFAEVQSNLEKLHLKTLWDIKSEHIFSKKGLIEYIQENKHLIR